MTTATFITGDSLTVLRALPDSCVDLVVTSPPFLALRSYLPADHPDKAHEIGQEATPGAFIDVLLDLTEEWARVLTPTGSLCVELGDTYSGSGGAGGDYGADGLRDGQPKFEGSNTRRGKIVDQDSGRRTPGQGWPLAKSLALIPESYRFALAYGRNPHTGRETDPWRVRNVVRWCRPNPPVGALGDKFRPATSEMVVACKSDRRWFDLDAVREPHKRPADANSLHHGEMGDDDRRNHNHGKAAYVNGGNEAGAPPLDWWDIPTHPYKGSHYAAFPPALVIRPVQAMCPREVCNVCGTARERLTGAFTLDSYRGSERTQTIRAVALADAAGLTDEHIAAVRAFGTSDAGKAQHINDGAGKNTDEVKRLAGEAKAVLGGYFREFVMSTNATTETTGWSDCGHGDYRPGRVLDPFAGSGTTLQVATGHGRDAIGIDLDARNADLARDRVGMWLTEATVEEAVQLLS